MTTNLKNLIYSRSFPFEEAKIKQRTSSEKKLCEIGEEAIRESGFISFFYIRIHKLFVFTILPLSYLLSLLSGILDINKEYVLDIKCFEIFQLISQFLVRIGDHLRKCTCLKFIHIMFLEALYYYLHTPHTHTSHTWSKNLIGIEENFHESKTSFMKKQ